MSRPSTTRQLGGAWGRWRAHGVLSLAAASVLPSLQGCVPYPIHKTLQPEASVEVVSAEGLPVAGAEVLLMSASWPSGREQFRQSALTDAHGRARWPAIREWQVESLALHGAAVQVWQWCVRMPGFETQTTARQPAEHFVSRWAVRLQPGLSTPCPAAPG